MKDIKTRVKHTFCKPEREELSRGKKTFISSYKKEMMKEGEMLKINEFGFLNDTQSDKANHGGVDKAVCVYSYKYYPFFKQNYDIDLPLCAFGENFTILDLDDSEVCLGDRFSCGEVVFEVTQPRQPCFKISAVLGIKNFTATATKEHKSGFYFRVIKGGDLKVGDDLVLISRPFPKLSIEHVNRCAFDAKNNQENIKQILECDKLSKAYRASLERRYKNKEQGIQEFQKDEAL